jgi:hypothetical protein
MPAKALNAAKALDLGIRFRGHGPLLQKLGLVPTVGGVSTGLVGGGHAP